MLSQETPRLIATQDNVLHNASSFTKCEEIKTTFSRSAGRVADPWQLPRTASGGRTCSSASNRVTVQITADEAKGRDDALLSDTT